MQKIRPFLWYDDQAEEAANFYVEVFGGDSTVLSASGSGVTFRLRGTEYLAFNGGPDFSFSEAVSLFVDCADQAEVDDLWAKLSEDGQPGRCGWLKDKFGLSWQIIPRALGEMLSDDDEEKSGRAMDAMLEMSKIDIAELQAAYDGR